MKKLILKSTACLIALVGFSFGAATVSAEDIKTEAAAVVAKSGSETEYTSDKMNDAWNAAADAGQGAVLKLMSDWKPGIDSCER